PVAGRPAGTAAAGPFSAGARGAEPYGRPCGPDPAALRGGGAAPPAGAVAGGPPHHYVSTHVRFPSRSAPAPRVGALVGPGPPGGAGRTGVRGPKALRGGDHAARAAGGRPGRGGADRQRERALPQPVPAVLRPAGRLRPGAAGPCGHPARRAAGGVLGARGEPAPARDAPAAALADGARPGRGLGRHAADRPGRTGAGEGGARGGRPDRSGHLPGDRGRPGARRAATTCPSGCCPPRCTGRPTPTPRRPAASWSGSPPGRTASAPSAACATTSG